jgi:hypothetical protein
MHPGSAVFGFLQRYLYLSVRATQPPPLAILETPNKKTEQYHRSSWIEILVVIDQQDMKWRSFPGHQKSP